MWRLLVTSSADRLSFMLCRPTRAAEFLSEDCRWRVDLKKPENLQTVLQDDEFLFLMMANLHEKLPIRDFNPLGDQLARPEPRFKSPVLENPPALRRGFLSFDRTSGQLLITPVSVFQESASPGTTWFIPAQNSPERNVALEELIRKSGYELLQPSAQPPLKQARALAANRGSDADSAQRINVSRRTNRRGSIFASESIAPPPDDREVVKLKGAQHQEEPSPIAARRTWLDDLWDVLWPGRWQSSWDAHGLPVPESERSRLPAVQSLGVSAWHPIWKTVSIGGAFRYTLESEQLSLKISLPGSALFQQADGNRSFTVLSGMILSEFPITSDSILRIEAKMGRVFHQSRWSYDRKQSTFELWAPPARGDYLEPLLSYEPRVDESGVLARVGYGKFEFTGASGHMWTIESGWQWSFDPEASRWGPLRASHLQTYAALNNGSIRNTAASISSVNADKNNEVLLRSLSLGLRLRIDETN